MVKEIKLIFGERSFKLTDEELEKIVSEAAASKSDEEKKEVIRAIQMHGLGAGLGFPGCFACGDFEEDTEHCGYSSKVRFIIDNGREESFCRRDDIRLKYVIESGRLESYEIKEADKEMAKIEKR